MKWDQVTDQKQTLCSLKTCSPKSVSIIISKHICLYERESIYFINFTQSQKYVKGIFREKKPLFEKGIYRLVLEGKIWNIQTEYIYNTKQEITKGVNYNKYSKF